MTEDQALYVVAELADDPRRVLFNWTSGVYTDITDAMWEMTRARTAGHTNERIYQLLPKFSLVELDEQEAPEPVPTGTKKTSG